MEMKSNKKGLFMTILILILFLLMLGELVTFALLNSNYNSLDQATAIGSGSINYGKAIQSSSTIFANASLNSALSVLANYELNASMRKNNFISNTSQYLTYLIVNGTLPSVGVNSIPANYLAKSMGNLTLSSYNKSLQNLFNLGAISIIVNESKPNIFQATPYTLSISYVENVALNSTTGKFTYQIPVSATISLNNTPDLFYYQQGIPQNIKFGQITNLTTELGGINATNGNFLGAIYGTIYNVPTGAAGLTCSSLSTMVSANVPAFSFAPYNQMLILATSNAIGITNGGSGPNCINQYGGLITYGINSISSPPSVPWLVYPSATNLLNNIKSGQHLLILGNTLSVYSIQNLLNATGSGYYFASPFAPSYLDRAQQSVLKQNPNGIFTLSSSSYTLQAANFNAISGYIGNIVAVGNQINTNAGTYDTVTFWMLWRGMDANGEMPIEFSGTGLDLEFGAATCFGFNTHNSDVYGLNPTNALNKWTFVAAKFYNGYTSNGMISINGKNMTLSQCAGSQHTLAVSNSLRIGGGYTFNGELANFQIYNTSLSQANIQTLYQEGIGGAPLSTNSLSGWWPLNGNTNDYSGNGNNGMVLSGNAIGFITMQNYSRDAIFPSVVPSIVSPVPGLLNCNSNSQCSNGLLSHVSLSYMPLEIQQNYLQVATFNSYGLVQIANAIPLSPTAAISISGWVYWPVSATKEMVVKNNNANTAPGSYEFFQSGQSIAFRLYKSASATTIASTNTLSLNSWHYITATWDGTTMKMYIDGVQDATTGSLSGPIDTTTGLLTLGAYANQLFPYVGGLSNLQIYDGPLSANQVSQLYKEGITGLPLTSTTANVLGWWPLNGNANDYSGYSNNGINSNVLYTSFSGSYNTPGLSSITTSANEWQVIGIPRSGG